MLRQKKYQTIFNRLLKDERISPNRRMLLALLQVYTDAMAAGEKDEAAKFWDVIQTQYGTPTKPRWIDLEDPGQSLGTTRLEAVAASEIRDIYASLGRENDGISNSRTSASNESAKPATAASDASTAD